MVKEIKLNYLGGLEYLIDAMSHPCYSQEEARDVFLMTYHFLKKILNEDESLKNG